MNMPVICDNGTNRAMTDAEYAQYLLDMATSNAIDAARAAAS